MSNPLGCIFGFILGSVWVQDADVNDRNVGHAHVQDYMRFTAIIATLFCVPTVLFFKEKPKEFPSESARSQMGVDFDFKGDLRALC